MANNFLSILIDIINSVENYNNISNIDKRNLAIKLAKETSLSCFQNEGDTGQMIDLLVSVYRVIPSTWKKNMKDFLCCRR